MVVLTITFLLILSKDKEFMLGLSAILSIILSTNLPLREKMMTVLYKILLTVIHASFFLKEISSLYSKRIAVLHLNPATNPMPMISIISQEAVGH